MGHILNREALRVVERNDRGIVTYRKRYTKGDEVDTSHMDEAHVKNLVDSGALVESEGDLSEAESATGTEPTSPPYGASTQGPGDATLSEATSGDGGPDEGNDSSDEDEHEVDRYDGMDYSELQAEAKSRGLSAGGSATDLRGRLRDADSE